MNKIAFAGTFDPITNGHLWVIQEALSMAREVVVIIAVNSTKKPLFSDSVRKKMIEEAVKNLPNGQNVTVEILKNEYVAQAAVKRFKCDYLIRGIRGALEFDYETLIQKTNTDILYGAKTLFVMPPRDLESVSSSFVKSLVGPVGWHWYIKKFVPDFVYRYWIEQYIQETAISISGHSTIKDFIDEIKEYYNKPGRNYHNLEHIAHGLQELQWLHANKPQPLENLQKICVAWLGHDVIYGAHNKDKSDEELSADFTYAWLVKNSIMSEEDALEISKMIEKTQYLSKNLKLETSLEKILCSMDLSILGQTQEIYQLYQNNIRQEYDNVSENIYKTERAKALKKLLAIPVFYEAQEFSHYEADARANLIREIQFLSQ